MTISGCEGGVGNGEIDGNDILYITAVPGLFLIYKVHINIFKSGSNLR